jgi:hypothetical protein
MGQEAVWLVAQTTDLEAVAEAMGFTPIGAADLNERFCATVLQSGWTVVLSYRQDQRLPTLLPALSTRWRAMGFDCYDVVMFSGAREFRDGRLLWSVEMNPDKDHRTLQITGEPPTELAAIQQSLLAEQAEVDAEVDEVNYLYNAPQDLSAALTGFEPGESIDRRWVGLVLNNDPKERSRRWFAEARRDDLTPMMRARGWTLGKEDAECSELEIDRDAFVRRRDGRLQVITLDGAGAGDDGIPPPGFQVWERRGADQLPIHTGALAPPPAPRRPPLWVTAPRALWSLVVRPPRMSREDWEATVLAKVRGQLQSIDDYLSTGTMPVDLLILNGDPAVRRPESAQET